MRRCLCASAVALVLASAGVLRAENTDAESLFRKGREAIVAGDTAKGCALLAESDRLEPSPGAKLGVALCEEQLEHFARAWTLLQRVIRSLPPTDERVAIAVRHSEEIAPKLAFVTIEVRSTGVPGTRITSDIAELTSAELGVALPFDPGPHFFQISAPGRQRQHIERVLRPGEHQHIELSLPEPAAPAPPAIPPVTAASKAAGANHILLPLGFALEGAAVALLATSLTTGAFALSEKQHVNEGCADTQAGCSDAALTAAARGNALATTSTVTMVGALTTAAIGTILLALNYSSKPKAISVTSTGFAAHF